MMVARGVLVAVIVAIPVLAGLELHGSETYYKTKSGVLTNMPTEDASMYRSYDVKPKNDKDLATEKLINQVIGEVQSIRESLRSYRGKSAEYLNKEYKFKPDIDITISSQISGETDKYKIYGKHARLKGYYAIDNDGNVENTLE